jgi:porin
MRFTRRKALLVTAVETKTTSGWRRLPPLLAAIAAGVMIGAPPVHAQDAKAPSLIWNQATLTGDWGGERAALDKKGVDIGINYIGETFDVLSGGLHERPSYVGRLEFSVDTDLQKLIGLQGASTHVTVYQIHDIDGVNAESNVGALADPSNVDALPTTRLFTAWYQQELANGRLSLRIGQLAADDEFMISSTAARMLNATWGWPVGFSANLPSTGPVYPLAAPGVRAKYDATKDVSVLAALFSGNPAGADCTDPNPQACDLYGTRFSFSGGAFAIAELQYAVNQGKEAKGLPGKYKLGAWYHSAEFADERFGLTAAGAPVSLADTPAVAAPLFHHGDFAIYGIADQTIWRQGGRSVSLFIRATGLPADRNLISYYVDGGAGFTGLVPGRENDVLTLGAAYSKISPNATAADQDYLALNGPPYAVRDYELLFEATYTARLAPWWKLQPDIQYFVHPNGGQDPNNPTLTLGHALVAGIRSTIKF